MQFHHNSQEDSKQGVASPWQNEVAKTRDLARNYRKVLDETFGTQVEIVEDIEATDDAIDNAEQAEGNSSPRKRAVSAKSHIFRKGKIETK